MKCVCVHVCVHLCMCAHADARVLNVTYVCVGVCLWKKLGWGREC